MIRLDPEGGDFPPPAATPSGAAPRVAVAMSGGVDSSVTAALLHEAGYDVVGITLHLVDRTDRAAGPGSCCAGQDLLDARSVAERIGISHTVFDYEDRFRTAVIDDFADTYAAGQTPNPCVRCNQQIKFGALLQQAKRMGAVALATGHYARRTHNGAEPVLRRGVDPVRDQSYFLFAVPREALAWLHFPLGGLDKEATRAEARRFGLPVAAKADSQDICFVAGEGYADLVRRLRPQTAEPGDIIDTAGRVLGRHNGVIGFTIGQRRGLGVNGPEPLYVVHLDSVERHVVVGPRAALARHEVPLVDMNWLAAEPPPATGLPVAAKLRSTQPERRAVLYPEVESKAGFSGRLVFDPPVYGVAPGQAAVCYDGDRVLGGGWIAATPAPAPAPVPAPADDR